MELRELITKELQNVPDDCLEELLDFVRFLETRSTPLRLDTAIASEKVLARDWLRREEDAAWKDL